MSNYSIPFNRPAIAGKELAYLEEAVEILRQMVRGGLTPGVYLQLAFIPSLESEAYDAFLEERKALRERLQERY